jgi:DNA-binding transcriptional LysR family regulator
MTIRHMRVFVTVCRYGSITAAAKELYISQPAVSLAIKELEDYYGITLFDRLTRQIQITSDGKRLLDYAIHLVNLFDDMEHALKDPDAVGELRIGSSLTIGACLLPGYTHILKDMYPKVKQHVTIDNSDNIVKAVINGRIDVGLVEGAVNSDTLISYPFAHDKLVAICGPAHEYADDRAVELDEFLAQPLLLREHGSGARELFESMVVATTGKLVEPVWESISNTALIYAVKSGNGVSVLPEMIVANYLKSGDICEINLNMPPVMRDFNLIYHNKKYLSSSIKSFIKIIMEHLI